LEKTASVRQPASPGGCETWASVSKEDWPECSLSLRQWRKIQEMLWKRHIIRYTDSFVENKTLLKMNASLPQDFLREVACRLHMGINEFNEKELFRDFFQQGFCSLVNGKERRFGHVYKAT
jgi:hypothetical protein